MDIKDRVMGDQPNSFLHKIASIVPGYQGYVDRERRRDADKLLRMHLARQYSEQRDRLTRVQQALLRARKLDQIDDVERLAGLLQRFIDRLSTATYGYAGLFAPVKVEAEDLDQLYAFDMALASGIEEVSSAISGIESSTSDAEELPTSVSRLESVLDGLNRRLNERSDLLTSGRRLEPGSYQSLVSTFDKPETSESLPSYPGMAPTAQETAAGAGFSGAGFSGAGEVARYPEGGLGYGSESGAGAMSQGEPTHNLNSTAPQSPAPGISSLTESNQGFAEQSSAMEMSGGGPSEIPLGGSAGTGVETASSPATAPGAPGGDLVEGLGMANSMGDVDSPAPSPEKN
ncbi:MAG TPA: hypothetical protein VEW94_14030 [Chloroflexia bacterium]|nr:hypothetical protein [Chloroflexia bacterium]